MMKGLLKRIWPVGLLLALCMLVLPSYVLAADTEEEFLIFGWGTQERYSAYSNASGNGWDWQAETRTLTLNNANLDKCIKVPVGTTILLKGNNAIKPISENEYKESIAGEGYYITGEGNLSVDNGITGGIIFKGTGNIMAGYIGNKNKDRNIHQIRFESGSVVADEIVIDTYPDESDNVNELIVLGGDISVNNVKAYYTDVLVAGGVVNVATTKKMECADLFSTDGEYKNGKFVGGHFTFIGGKLSINNEETALPYNIALSANFEYAPADVGLDFEAPAEEKVKYFDSVEPLIKLGDDVKIEGGTLSRNILTRGGIRWSAGDSESYEGCYGAYGFVKVGHSMKSPEDNAAVLTLSASDKKPEQTLWEPKFTLRSNVVSDNTPKEVTNTQTVSAQNGIKIMLNGSLLAFTETPYVANGTTMVPMRVIFEALKAEVNYDSATQKITATKGDTVVELVLGQKSAKKNAQTINLDVAAVTRNGNTMVPLRFVAEALNAQVDWDNATQTVVITLNE